MTRIHYVPGCPNESGDDSLAVTGFEAIRTVNCPDCFNEMFAVGLLNDRSE